MSENILKELYIKLINLFKQTEKNEENAKDIACNRLRVVLMQDRTNLTPKLLERMRGELVELLSKYVEMDKDALELNFDHEDGQIALMLSIPVIRAKEEEEIQKALDKEKTDEETKAEDDEENSSESEEDTEEAENTEKDDDESEEDETEAEDDDEEKDEIINEDEK